MNVPPFPERSVDPLNPDDAHRIRIKIADLGNSCWVVRELHVRTHTHTMHTHHVPTHTHTWYTHTHTHHAHTWSRQNCMLWSAAYQTKTLGRAESVKQTPKTDDLHSSL